MLEPIIEGLLDTAKIIPFLFATFLFLEFIEHKLSHKSTQILAKNQKFGPLLGALLGAIPQCSFSVMAAKLFSNKIITTGTLIAIFLSTSDEMLPIMISENANIFDILWIISIKIFIGLIIGLIVDLTHKRKSQKTATISKMCENEHCGCKHQGIFLSSLKHTAKISLFILIVNTVINLTIFFIGASTLSNLLLQKTPLTYFCASLIGLIPNCSGSVIITQLFLSKLITPGVMLAGLLTGNGLGLLLLFKTNKNLKENISILLFIYIIGVFCGITFDLFI